MQRFRTANHVGSAQNAALKVGKVVHITFERFQAGGDGAAIEVRQQIDRSEDEQELERSRVVHSVHRRLEFDFRRVGLAFGGDQALVQHRDCKPNSC